MTIATRLADHIKWVEADFTSVTGGRQFNARNEDLTEESFIGADLRYARLRHAIVSECDFTNADLTGANCSGADFTDSILTGAIVEGTNFRGAILTGTILDE